MCVSCYVYYDVCVSYAYFWIYNCVCPCYVHYDYVQLCAYLYYHVESVYYGVHSLYMYTICVCDGALTCVCIGVVCVYVLLSLCVYVLLLCVVCVVV